MTYFYRDIVTTGKRVLPNDWDKPNTHSVLELAFHTLPALMNANLASTQGFERRHVLSKAMMSTGGNKVGQKEDIATRRIVQLEGFKNALHGTTWGPDGDFKLGQGILNMRDYRQGREHLPHFLLETIAPTMIALQRARQPDVKATVRHQGKWIPMKTSLTRPTWAQDLTEQDMQSVRNRLLADDDDDDVPLDEHVNPTILYVHSILTIKEGGKRVKVTVGDHVRVEGHPLFSHVRVRAFVILQNVLACIADGYQLLRNKQSSRQNKMVMKPDMATAATAIFAETICEPVCIVHACQHLDDQQATSKMYKKTWGKDLGSLATTTSDALSRTCHVIRACINHASHKCKDAGCADKSKWNISLCHTARNKYEVFDADSGFHPTFENRRKNKLFSE